MNLLMLLDMVAAGHGDRLCLGTSTDGLTGDQLHGDALAGASVLRAHQAGTVVYLGENGLGFPVALFAAAAAGIPFLPLNYRSAAEQIREIVARTQRPFVIADDPSTLEGLDLAGLIDVAQWRSTTRSGARSDPEDRIEPAPDDEAVLLMTSGTTATPKSAVLRHRHLVSYVLGSVEFGAADPDDAMIVSVPPYHIAAVANLLSNLYSGRRIVYLERFTAASWLKVVAQEGITHAMLVPTMLSRIVDELEAGNPDRPTKLRSLSYGGAALSPSVLHRALTLLPEVGFVNAYGLTETSSSISVLGPEDHREAVASSDPRVRGRLGSVGRPLPNVEIEIRAIDDSVCAAGQIGQIHVRGPQVAGEYRETASTVSADGWFPTRDEGYLDADGYLFVRGRADDTIIRGGENIAPAEIENVLHLMPGLADAVVAGIPDEEWGQRIGAFVVAAPGAQVTETSVRDWVRAHLRSSKTPDVVTFLAELPRTPTGKILRRNLVPTVPAPVPTAVPAPVPSAG